MSEERDEQPGNQSEWTLSPDVNLIRTLEGHESSGINGIAFEPNGRMLASGSTDQTIKLWDTSAPRVLHQLRVGRQ
jgi:WD40 repeat protein